MPYFELGLDKKLIVPYADYMNAIKPDFEYIGDEAEILDIVRTLYLPNANSLKLVGARGSGTSALMDALAHNQTADFMPDEFMIRPIYKFNGNNLFSTSDDGAIEARFKAAMEELQRHHSNRKVKPVLVIEDGCSFVDNAPQHVINMLVEADTKADYIDIVIGVDKKKEVEFNKAHPEFENGFSTKVLKEPEDEKIIAILEHHAKKHLAHNVQIDRDALEYIVSITQRFSGMYSTAQPNRAIRLLDSAATDFRIKLHSQPPGTYEKNQELRKLNIAISADGLSENNAQQYQTHIDTLEIEIGTATEAWEKHRKEIKTLQNEIREFDILVAQSQKKIDSYNEETKTTKYNELKSKIETFAEADPSFKGRVKADILRLDRDALLKFYEFDLMVHQNPKIKGLHTDIAKYSDAIDIKQKSLRGLSDQGHQPTVLPNTIIEDVASAETKTPVNGITGRLKENLRQGATLMKQTVFGQDHVIEPIIKSLKRAAAGLNDKDRPLGCFMIAGPPGTGKTWTSEQLAVQLFGSKEYYVELNMNDFSEKHTVSALLGAPPGYSGYGKKGRLIEIGQSKPFCVLCLDEIEKAHPDIRQALLAMKGRGYMMGLDGESADFRNIVIVETSNFGNDKGIWNGSYDDGVTQLNQLLRSSGDIFSPEYLDRNDQILCAGPLDQHALKKIVVREIEKMQATVHRNHPHFNIEISDESFENFVKDHCLDKSGRRSEMMINKMIGDHVTDKLLNTEGEIIGVLRAEYNSSEGNSFEFDFRDAAPEKDISPTKQFGLNGGAHNE